jgi:hypothetical protein
MTPPIIDLAPAGETMDGARVYTRPLEAALIQSRTALGRLCGEYPRETVGVLAAAAWAAVSAYFVNEALKPHAAHRTRRRSKSTARK